MPLPLAPLLIVSQAALLVAVQPQLAPVVMATVPVAAADEPRFEEVGEMVYEHGVVPGCVTVNVWPPMVMVPERDVVPVLAATE